MRGPFPSNDPICVLFASYTISSHVTTWINKLQVIFLDCWTLHVCMHTVWYIVHVVAVSSYNKAGTTTQPEL